MNSNVDPSGRSLRCAKVTSLAKVCTESHWTSLDGDRDILGDTSLVTSSDKDAQVQGSVEAVRTRGTMTGESVFVARLICTSFTFPLSIASPL